MCVLRGFKRNPNGPARRLNYLEKKRRSSNGTAAELSPMKTKRYVILGHHCWAGLMGLEVKVEELLELPAVLYSVQTEGNPTWS